MSSFDRTRFAEAFVAAILGGAVHNHLQGTTQSQDTSELARKYQRALILAMNLDGFTAEVSRRYFQRVGDLHSSQRFKYMRITLQPSDSIFDERLTSVMIFDHALKSDIDWLNFLKVFSLDSPNSYEAAVGAGKSAFDQFGEFLSELNEHARHKQIEREDRLSRGWWARLQERIVRSM